MTNLSNEEVDALAKNEVENHHADHEVAKGLQGFFMQAFRPIFENWLKKEVEIHNVVIKNYSSKEDEELKSILEKDSVVLTHHYDSDISGTIHFVLSPEDAIYLTFYHLGIKSETWSQATEEALSTDSEELAKMLGQWIDENYGVPLKMVESNCFSTNTSAYMNIEDTVFQASIKFTAHDGRKITINAFLNHDFSTYLSQLFFDNLVDSIDPSKVLVRPISFSQFGDEKNQDQNKEDDKSGSIDLLLDVSMQLTVVLGKTKIKIKDILSIEEGSIIELQKLAGEPVDVLVNDKVIANGEVVVIDEYFGVRVTGIVVPEELKNSIAKKE